MRGQPDLNGPLRSKKGGPVQHFRFGENWSDFVGRLQPEQIAEAQKSLQDLLGRETLAGAQFLDIGCGSGLFSLVASRLGAAVTSIDRDTACIETTQSLRNAATFPQWQIRQGSILDCDFVGTLGQFEIVYSWGVLHHTGAMWSALDNAAARVKPGGTLAIALYRRTTLCPAWSIEKRIYAGAPRPLQAVVRAAYKSAFVAGLVAKGRNPMTHIRGYDRNRGMNWHSDVHDWLGGYPYESARAADVKARLDKLGFDLVRSVERPGGFGLFGSGCDEYVAVARAG